MDYPIALAQIEDFLQTFGSFIEHLYIRIEEINFDAYHLNNVLMQINNDCINFKVRNMKELVVEDAIPNEI